MGDTERRPWTRRRTRIGEPEAGDGIVGLEGRLDADEGVRVRHGARGAWRRRALRAAPRMHACSSGSLPSRLLGELIAVRAPEAFWRPRSQPRRRQSEPREPACASRAHAQRRGAAQHARMRLSSRVGSHRRLGSPLRARDRARARGVRTWTRCRTWTRPPRQAKQATRQAKRTTSILSSTQHIPRPHVDLPVPLNTLPWQRSDVDLSVRRAGASLPVHPAERLRPRSNAVLMTLSDIVAPALAVLPRCRAPRGSHGAWGGSAPHRLALASTTTTVATRRGLRRRRLRDGYWLAPPRRSGSRW